MTIITPSDYRCKCGAPMFYEGRELSGGLDGDRKVTDRYRCSNPACGCIKSLRRSEAELKAEQARRLVGQVIQEARQAVSDQTVENMVGEAAAYLERKETIRIAFLRDNQFLTEDFYQTARRLIQESSHD